MLPNKDRVWRGPQIGIAVSFWAKLSAIPYNQSPGELEGSHRGSSLLLCFESRVFKLLTPHLRGEEIEGVTAHFQSTRLFGEGVCFFGEPGVLHTYRIESVGAEVMLCSLLGTLGGPSDL